MNGSISPEHRPTAGGMLLQHLFVFMFCIVFPGLVTALAPAAWITFQRTEAGVQCTVRTCAYFVVPFRVQHVDSVTGIGQQVKEGGLERVQKFGRPTDKKVNVQGEGTLQILGAGEAFLEVSVSPASLETVVAKSESFLASTSEDSKTLFAIANWKFGAIMGGILTSLTVLYVIGCIAGCIKWILRLLGKSTSLSDFNE